MRLPRWRACILAATAAMGSRSAGSVTSWLSRDALEGRRPARWRRTGLSSGCQTSRSAGPGKGESGSGRCHSVRAGFRRCPALCNPGRPVGCCRSAVARNRRGEPGAVMASADWPALRAAMMTPWLAMTQVALASWTATGCRSMPAMFSWSLASCWPGVRS